MSDLTDRTSAILDDTRGRRRLAEIIAVAHALTALSRRQHVAGAIMGSA